MTQHEPAAPGPPCDRGSATGLDGPALWRVIRNVHALRRGIVEQSIAARPCLATTGAGQWPGHPRPEPPHPWATTCPTTPHPQGRPAPTADPIVCHLLAPCPRIATAKDDPP